MAYKRQTDRLPIIPADAKEHNVVCHYCIVGCGYKAYTWDMDRQGTTDPAGNIFKTDLSKQQGAETEAWYSPSMYNVVRQDGKDVHIVIKPDTKCVVNSGLGSVRGARMAEMSYSPVRSTEQQRLTDPMVWRYGQMQPTSLGGRPRPRRAGDGGGDQRPGGGRPVRLRLRPRRRWRRLREHMGHGQALLRGDEDQEHPHPQSPGLQL